MISEQWLSLEDRDSWKPLFDGALKARRRAYAPYSSFSVGAAVQTLDGSIFLGANYESASYGLTMCAERNALVAVQMAGLIDDLKAIAICAESARETVSEDVVRPCGACRQLIFEASARAGRDLIVLCGNQDFSKVWQTSAHQLLPDGFSL